MIEIDKLTGQALDLAVATYVMKLKARKSRKGCLVGTSRASLAPFAPSRYMDDAMAVITKMRSAGYQVEIISTNGIPGCGDGGWTVRFIGCWPKLQSGQAVSTDLKLAICLAALNTAPLAEVGHDLPIV